MCRSSCCLAIFAVLAGFSGTALAQADAQAAYQAAKTAFQAGKTAEARDLAKKASETDPKNAEVLLLLGKAHYELGELEEAVAAWKRTLAVAPQESHAKRMLAALLSRQADFQTRIRLVEALIDDGLSPQAEAACLTLSAERAMTDAQRAQVLALQVEVAGRAGRWAEMQSGTRELAVLYAGKADPKTTALLETWADLHGDAKAENQDRVAKWLAENAKSRLAGVAKHALLDAHLAVIAHAEPVTEQAELGPADAAILDLAVSLIGPGARAVDADAIVAQVLKYVDARFGSKQAYGAAAQAAQRLVEARPPRNAAGMALRAVASYQTAAAIKSWAVEAKAGRLAGPSPLGAIPEPWGKILAVYAAIDATTPEKPCWTERAQLMMSVRGLSAQTQWPEPATGLRTSDAAAISIALAIVRANADAAAVAKSVELAKEIAAETSKLPGEIRLRMPIEIGRAVLAAPLALSDPSWEGVILRQADALAAVAKHEFEENVKRGRATENGKLSASQKELVDALAALVRRNAGQAAPALEKLQENLKPWMAAGQWSVAEEAYAALAKAVPEASRWHAELAIASLWVDQAKEEHQRLVQGGFSVPRSLDPRLKQALVVCYDLQSGPIADCEPVREAQALADAILAHYRKLEYDNVVEEAIKVAGEKPVATADDRAAFLLADLREQLARRELVRQLNRFGGSKNLAMTDAMKASVEAWKKYVTDRPDGNRVFEAASRISSIARFFDERGAYPTAAAAFSDLADFSAGLNALSHSPGNTSVAEHAAKAAADSLDSHAKAELAKAEADRRPTDAPPTAPSKEFLAAIAQYKAFFKKYPESRLADDCVRRIVNVATTYAYIDAWEAAGSVYADLASSKLPLRSPERLEFARGLCKLGEAMSAHALEILKALPIPDAQPSAASTNEKAEKKLDRDAELMAKILEVETRRSQLGNNWLQRQYLAVTSGTPVGVQVTNANGGVLQLAGANTYTGTTTVNAPNMVTNGGVVRNRQSRDAQTQPQVMLQNGTANPQSGGQTIMVLDGYGSPVANSPMRGENLADNAVAIANTTATQTFTVQLPAQQGESLASIPVYSEAEFARREKAIGAAYEIFQGIRKKYPGTPTADQARAEVFVMVAHWRSLGSWQRSTELAARYLKDNPTDPDLAKLRLSLARDRLSWAAFRLPLKEAKQDLLAGIAKRFAAAREDFASIAADLRDDRASLQEAQWELANSHLLEARVIKQLSPTLARGQYVRAVRELRLLAERNPQHPKLGQITALLWKVSEELASQGFDDEAIAVWTELRIHDPMNDLARQSGRRIAETYRDKLRRPLKAAEAFQELNFAAGGNDAETQNAIFQIGSTLKNEKRWVESLHVLETFVASFPKNPQAGVALTMVGQIHQTNEAWNDAIAAYRRVIAEYKEGQWVLDAKWSIAECTINLSQWREAAAAYRDFAAAYPKDEKAAEANRRIEILKDLARYQGLVDEKGQRKAFDAQFQIATIVRTQLANPVKAVIEYRKVVTNWPESYMAAAALNEIGNAYLALNDLPKAREAFQQVAKNYPTSPLASGALFLVGKSYEDEADRLGEVTREKSEARNWDIAQGNAYRAARDNVQRQQAAQQERIGNLKKSGKGKLSFEVEEAFAQNGSQLLFNDANTLVMAQKAVQEAEIRTATELADRQDRINAALRKAVDSYKSASKIPGGNKADVALLQMATIFDQRLKDSKAAMETWLEIVRQFSGTAVAEDASWKLAQYYEREGKYDEAIEAYNAFLRNYRRSPNAGAAQFAVAECYEHQGSWVAAMDSYGNYIASFPDGPLVAKAKEQINWIKTYRL